MQVLTSKSTKKYENKFILAIGGGTVIDNAKVIAKKEKKWLIAIPTTGSGASETSHAVEWGETKVNIPVEVPLSLKPPFKIKLSKTARRNTCYDIIGHLVDVVNVCSDNDLVEIGMQLGRWIEKYPTNLTHPKSYPLTLNGIPHGEAVGKVLKECIDLL